MKPLNGARAGRERRTCDPAGNVQLRLAAGRRRGMAGRPAAFLAACLLLAGALTGSALAVVPATGNRAAIAFYRAAAARNNSVAIQHYVRRGFVSYYAFAGGESPWGLVWGNQPAPTSAYVHATEHLTVAQRGGRIVWSSEVLTPPPCHRPCVKDFSLQLVDDAHGQFVRYLIGGSSSLCWQMPSYGSLPLPTPGEVDFLASGHFLPLLRHRGTVIVRFTFPWGRTQTALATDRFAAATKLWESEVVHVPRAKGLRAVTFTITDVRSSARFQGPPQTTPLCGS